MKEQELAVARGQDPDKACNHGEYLKMLAELHEREAKIINQFYKYVETGKLEDAEALKKLMKPYNSMRTKTEKERKRLCQQFIGPMRSFCADVLFFYTSNATHVCENIISNKRKEA